MKMVKVPFNPRFEGVMRSGRKTWTSRTRRYGAVGDRFPAFGMTFEIKTQFPMLLGVVAREHFWEEGFESPEEFSAFWKLLHPRKGFVPEQKVVVHGFRRYPLVVKEMPR